MTQLFYTYLLTLPFFFAIDLLWLGVIAKDFYHKLMSPVVTIEFNIIAGALFYLLFIVGIFIFSVYPGVQAASLSKTLIYGALFGFFCYMTYDLTNLATVKAWPITLVVIDILWGTLLSTVTAFVAYKIYFFLQ